ncbi:MAG TPA: hypothetical protein VMX36_03970, partial [Sedimentisphaerales bacterium]|nr:hypothetical protein [Sedimentisphaerales bacterium]
HCEATACGRGNLYPANGRDCFASLAMTKNTILYTRQAYVVPEKLATPNCTHNNEESYLRPTATEQFTEKLLF